MGLYRIERLNSELQRAISALIMKGEVKDPRVSKFLSVNRVEVSRDLSFAKVYVSSFLPDGEIEKGVIGLNSAAGFIQTFISKKMRIRKFPKMTFIKDESMKGGFNMVNRLTRLENAQNENSLNEE